MTQEFSSRFARHKDELEWLFMELYNNREGLEVLEREMADAYDARSAELKALDKARAADPNWYKRGNMFGMTMYTDLFAGNLKELAKKLPYFKEQKLTYLHLMPLLQMPHPHNDGGYAVEDFVTFRLPGFSVRRNFSYYPCTSRRRTALEAYLFYQIIGIVYIAAILFLLYSEFLYSDNSTPSICIFGSALCISRFILKRHRQGQ